MRTLAPHISLVYFLLLSFSDCALAHSFTKALFYRPCHTATTGSTFGSLQSRKRNKFGAMQQHLFNKALRSRLLLLMTRAAFAVSAGSYTTAIPPGDSLCGDIQERHKSHFESGWLRPSLGSRPAFVRAAAADRSSSTELCFRRGPSVFAEELSPAALEAWPWKNPQGILVSPMDRRHYRWLVLPNGLQVMVISDPTATKAAAAMSVDVGAASDPAALPGLAHFLEHMLFLGTSKYPEENAYKSYLSKHGGRSNASTSMDVTTFKFDVGAEHLRGALDIFSQFFISPLFTESSTARELLAVDSEDSKNRTNDSRRILQVLKALARPEHSYSKFSTGNAKTLKDDVPENLNTRDELLAFHERHYHAPNMALVVLGKQDLDVLEEWARHAFEEVRTASSAAADSATAAASSEQEDRGLGERPAEARSALTASASPDERDGTEEIVAQRLSETFRSPWNTPPAVIVDFEPLRESRRLKIMWPMPPVRELWRNSPTRLLSHLMGHAGTGSLFATLQERGLATSVSAGLRTAYDDFCLFQVNVSLTVEGRQKWQDVANLVHARAKLVRDLDEESIQRAWKEARDMNAIYLRFQQEVSPYNAVTSLSRRLQLYPPEEVLSAGGVLDMEIEPALFSAFADYLRPENTLTWRVWKRKQKTKSDATPNADHAKGVTTEDLRGDTVPDKDEADEAQPLLEERWYGVKYGASPTPPALLDAWSDPSDSSLSLPGPNVFIPDDFSLVCDKASVSDGEEAQPLREASTNIAIDGDRDSRSALTNGCRAQSEADACGAKKEGSEETGAALRSSVSSEKLTNHSRRPGVVTPANLLEIDRDGVAEEGQLWHRLDTSFRQPRAYVRLVLGTPVVKDGGPQATEHASIMASILHKVLAQRTYDAQVAGLRWRVGPHPCGYMVQVDGFSQKIDPLLQEVVEAFLDPVAAAGGAEAFEKHFHLAKERAVRSAKSWAMGRPDDIAHYYNTKALEPSTKKNRVLDPGHLKVAKNATLEGCLSLHKQALSSVLPVGLVYGNASPKDGERIWKSVVDRLNAAGCQPLPEEAYPRSQVGVLPAGKLVNLRIDGPNPDDINSATIAYWQLGEREDRKFATLVLLAQMMREPCFTELRTKQQIGYVVASGLHSYGRGSRQLGFSVRALSKTMSPDDICTRIDNFVPRFREMVAAMPAEEFDAHVSSLMKRRLEPPKKADDEFSILANEVFTGALKWDRAAVTAEMLESVTREELLQLLDEEMLAADRTKRMNVLVYGKDRLRPVPPSDDGSESDTIELVPETLLDFKSSLPMQDATLTPQQALAAAQARGS